MARANGATSADALVDSKRRAAGVTGVSVRVWSDVEGTWVEVRQQEPGGSPEGSIRSVQKFPRRSSETPDPLLMAAFLARMVSAYDREGWEGIRS